MLSSSHAFALEAECVQKYDNDLYGTLPAYLMFSNGLQGEMWPRLSTGLHFHRGLAESGYSKLQSDP